MIVVAKNYRVNKVGLALDISNIKNTYLRNIILPIEKPYWNYLLHENNGNGIYNAPVDTTFCIVKPNEPFTYQALRIGGVYTCRHVDWDMNFDNIIPEQQYYMEHADERIATTKQHIRCWLLLWCL